jgi:hypothetical protein
MDNGDGSQDSLLAIQFTTILGGEEPETMLSNSGGDHMDCSTRSLVAKIFIQVGEDVVAPPVDARHKA